MRYLNLFLFVAILSCSSSPSIKKSNPVEEDSSSKFKTWLQDTVPEFRKWQQKKSLSIRNLSFTEDSLVFTVSEKFTSNIKSDKSSIPEIQDMLNLFSEYNELSKSDFRLAFVKRSIYEPSEIKRFKYNLSQEIDSIYITTSSQEINYILIRGRLSEKKIRSLIDPSSTKTTQFIWEGNVLKKVEE